MRYVTRDETWIFFSTSQSNGQSAESTLPSDSLSKRPRMQNSAGKEKKASNPTNLLNDMLCFSAKAAHLKMEEKEFQYVLIPYQNFHSASVNVNALKRFRDHSK